MVGNKLAKCSDRRICADVLHLVLEDGEPSSHCGNGHASAHGPATRLQEEGVSFIAPCSGAQGPWCTWRRGFQPFLQRSPSCKPIRSIVSLLGPHLAHQLDRRKPPRKPQDFAGVAWDDSLGRCRKARGHRFRELGLAPRALACAIGLDASKHSKMGCNGYVYGGVVSGNLGLLRGTFLSRLRLQTGSMSQMVMSCFPGDVCLGKPMRPYRRRSVKRLQARPAPQPQVAAGICKASLRRARSPMLHMPREHF